MSKADVTLETIDLIRATKTIINQQINKFKVLSSKGQLATEDMKDFKLLLSGLKDMSIQERAWEDLYGVKHLTEEQLSEEVVAVCGKLGIDIVGKSLSKASDKKKMSWKLVDGVRVWTGTKADKGVSDGK